MITSPDNIIEGLFNIVTINADNINKLVRYYRKDDSLHLFKGIRKTAKLTDYPCIEMEPIDGSMEWTTLSAMTSEYVIDCVLTLNCGDSVDKGVEYVSRMTQRIMKIFNYPPNMTWIIPNEYQDSDNTIPQICQYSDIRNVTYGATNDFAIRVARWQMNCRVLESFPYPIKPLLGPAVVDWKNDYPV